MPPNKELKLAKPSVLELRSSTPVWDDFSRVPWSGHHRHCDDEWSVLTAAGMRSTADARARAERTYPGVSRLWVDVGVSRAQALAYAEKASRDFKCSFCGRRPDQVRNLLAQGELKFTKPGIVEPREAV
jgi:hypothetical protein